MIDRKLKKPARRRLAEGILGGPFQKDMQGWQPKKSAKGDPAALQLTDVSLQIFFGEEAPEARTSAPLSIDSGPRNRRSR